LNPPCHTISLPNETPFFSPSIDVLPGLFSRQLLLHLQMASAASHIFSQRKRTGFLPRTFSLRVFYSIFFPFFRWILLLKLVDICPTSPFLLVAFRPACEPLYVLAPFICPSKVFPGQRCAFPNPPAISEDSPPALRSSFLGQFSFPHATSKPVVPRFKGALSFFLQSRYAFPSFKYKDWTCPH